MKTRIRLILALLIASVVIPAPLVVAQQPKPTYCAPPQPVTLPAHSPSVQSPGIARAAAEAYQNALYQACLTYRDYGSHHTAESIPQGFPDQHFPTCPQAAKDAGVQQYSRDPKRGNSELWTDIYQQCLATITNLPVVIPAQSYPGP